MAETEELIELGWKLGFFGSVSNAVYTHSFQIVTVTVESHTFSLSTPRCKAEHRRGRTRNRAGYAEVRARAPSI